MSWRRMRSGLIAANTVTAVATLSFITSTTSLSSTISAPATVNAGDLLILGDYSFGSSGSPSLVIPSGFTQISTNIHDGNEERQTLSYKLADGSEDGATLTGQNGNVANGKALLLFRGDVPITSATVQNAQTENTSGNPSGLTTNSSGGVVPLVVIGAYGSAGAAISPRTMSPTKDGEVNPAVWFYLAYKIYNSSPANVFVDMDDEGSANIIGAFYIEVS